MKFLSKKFSFIDRAPTIDLDNVTNVMKSITNLFLCEENTSKIRFRDHSNDRMSMLLLLLGVFSMITEMSHVSFFISLSSFHLASATTTSLIIDLIFLSHSLRIFHRSGTEADKKRKKKSWNYFVWRCEREEKRKKASVIKELMSRYKPNKIEDMIMIIENVIKICDREREKIIFQRISCHKFPEREFDDLNGSGILGIRHKLAIFSRKRAFAI